MSDSKSYKLAIYDKYGYRTKEVLSNFTFDGFSKRYNSGFSELVVKVPSKLNEFKQGTLNLNNKCVLFVNDKDSSGDKRIYSGYLESANVRASGTQHFCEIVIVGHFNKLGKKLAYSNYVLYTLGGDDKYEKLGGYSTLKTDTTRGLTYTASSASESEVSNVIKATIDFYKANSINPQINYHQPKELYDSYLFNNNTYKQYLKLYWRCEGNLNDSSGNSSTGTNIASGGTYTVEEYVESPEDNPMYSLLPLGYFGRAYYKYDASAFAGASAVDKTALKPTGQFSVGAWIKTNTDAPTVGATQCIMQSANSITGAFRGFVIYISHTDGKAKLYLDDGTGSISLSSTSRIDDGKWHQVVMSRDSAKYYIYIDGVLESTLTSAKNPAYHATNYFRVAGYRRDDEAGFYAPLNGFVDDVFMFNGYALVQRDVTELWGVNYLDYTGNTMTYVFTTRTYKDIIDRCMEFIPSTYIYYIDADDVFHLQQKYKIEPGRFDNLFIVGKRYADSLFWYCSMDKYVATGASTYTVSPDNVFFSSLAPTSLSDLKIDTTGSDSMGAGLEGSSFYGNGSSNYGTFSKSSVILYIPDVNENMTWSCWVKFNVLSVTQGILSVYHETAGAIAHGWRLYIDASNKITFALADGISAWDAVLIATDANAIKDFDWHFIAVTAEYVAALGGWTVKIYIDANLVATGAIDDNAAGTIGTYKMVGCLNVSGTRHAYLNGYIDNIGIGKQALTQEDIFKLYYGDKAKHNLVVGKSIKDISISKSMKDVVNNAVVAGSAASTIFNNYFDNDSDPDDTSMFYYDDLWSVSSDERVTNIDTADVRGQSNILSSKRSTSSLSITVLDNSFHHDGYDIESFELGDSVKIINLEEVTGIKLNEVVYTIMSIDYRKTYAVLELNSPQDILGREIARIKTKQGEDDASSHPVSFLDVPVGG